MKNFFSLVKINMQQVFNAMFLTSKKNKIKNTSAIASTVLILVAVVGYVMFLNVSMFVGYANSGVQNLGLLFVFSTYFLLMVMLFTVRLETDKKTDDAELLLSMPLKKSTIIFSKLFTKLFLSLLATLIFILPIAIADFALFGFDFVQLLRVLHIIIFAPLLFLGVGYILEFILFVAFNGKKAGQILRTIFSTAVVIAFVAFYTYINTAFNAGLVTGSNVAELENLIPLVPIYTQFYAVFSLQNLVIITLLGAVPFVIGAALNAATFNKQFYSKSDKKEVVFAKKLKSTFSLLLGKEARFYFSNSGYVANTIIGPFMALIVLAMGSMLPGEFGFMIYALTLVFGVSLCFISASSISLEGKNFWVLKSSPISAKQVLLAKAVFNLLICSVVGLPVAIAGGVVLNVNASAVVALCLLVMFASLFISLCGVLINLYFPKFDYQSVTAVVKQSLSVLITMAIGFAVTAIVSVFTALMFINGVLALNIALYISAAIVAVMCIAIYFVLISKGVKKYSTLEC